VRVADAAIGGAGNASHDKDSTGDSTALAGHARGTDPIAAAGLGVITPVAPAAARSTRINGRTTDPGQRWHGWQRRQPFRVIFPIERPLVNHSVPCGPGVMSWGLLMPGAV
jgi:hypothetical protein